MIKPGLYEQVINNKLDSELSLVPAARQSTAPIDQAEAAKVLSQYLTEVVQQGLDNVADNGGDIAAQIDLANRIVSVIHNATNEADFATMGVSQRAEQLLALLKENDPRLLLGKTADDVERPETSVAQSSLFTGAIHEPQMFSELKKEIGSADQIDMLVSFIKWSGLRLIMDELRDFTQNGGQLRIITTSYMGATDIKAIEELSKLPNTEIKVSYDTNRTRLHAKTYVFYRDTGFTTAYVGSSNLSKPKILLGLTATPERMDGKSILDYFGGRIAAEIRLPEAIDRKLLCPFQYFGVADTVDLTDLRWVRGGYDKSQLSNLYSLNRAVAQRRADHIVRSLDRYVTDMDAVKGLGFCVSIEHAKFMAEHFNAAGIPSISLVGQSADDERRTAKQRLVNGEIRFIFVVDIYNEGVDIPEVNTVLFLRPTESLTIFLQQLGRGLRLSDGKECLTVLDFIGQANRKYNFEEKFEALLSNTNHSVQHEVKTGFISAPKGCYIQLEKKAAQAILENIKGSFHLKSGLVCRITTFEEDSSLPLTLANFAAYYRLDIRTVLAKYSFARLCVTAGVREDFDEPAESVVTKALGRIAAIDSRRWIRFLMDILPKLDNTNFNTLSANEKRMLQMFYITLWMKSADSWDSQEVLDNLYGLADSPTMIAEILEVLQYKYDHIDFIDAPVNLGFECPLDLHCTYTRDQLLVALDFMNPNSVREGVKWLPEKKVDVLFVTLNKSDKDYSPTTMYKDYSINDVLFHWQSQSTTTDTRSVGQRYINHRAMGTKLLLFVREFRNDIAGTAPYTYLGTVNYVKHTGSRPMNITWKLDNPIPAKYLKKTKKLVVG